MIKEEVGNWFIAHVTEEQETNHAKPILTIKAIEIMDEVSYKRYKDDKSAISEYFSSLNLIQSIQFNIQDFCEAIVNYANDFLKTRDIDENKFDAISINFSRLLLNILSMFRSFLDHSNASLLRTFGKNSTQMMRWEKALSKIYDSSFEYRFFYKLRNYVQHVDMPPMQISYSDSVHDANISFRLDFSRNLLLEEKRVWGEQLKKDLSSQPEIIPVIDCLNKWSETFSEISKLLLKIKREVAIDSAKRIFNHRERLQLSNKGKLCVIWLSSKNRPNPNEINLSMDWLPEQKALSILEVDSFSQNDS